MPDCTMLPSSTIQNHMLIYIAVLEVCILVKKNYGVHDRAGSSHSESMQIHPIATCEWLVHRGGNGQQKCLCPIFDLKPSRFHSINGRSPKPCLTFTLPWQLFVKSGIDCNKFVAWHGSWPQQYPFLLINKTMTAPNQTSYWRKPECLLCQSSP